MASVQDRCGVYLSALFLLVCGTAQAQYSSDVFSLKRAQELYDERGFEQSKSISVDGKLVVSHSNGNVSYNYPIANYTQGGYPVKVDLNYCGSAAFSTYKNCVLATRGAGSVPAGSYQGWSRFHQNRPVWILGVNGFAVIALVSTTHFLNDSASLLQGEGVGRHYYDQQLIWMLDGYDVCNRMNDFDPVASGQNTLVDVIKLLRSDGSVLELRNTNARPANGNIDTMRYLYSGYYHPTDGNPKGYAVVTFDDRGQRRSSSSRRDA